MKYLIAFLILALISTGCTHLEKSRVEIEYQDYKKETQYVYLRYYSDQSGPDNQVDFDAGCLRILGTDINVCGVRKYSIYLNDEKKR